MPVQLDITDRRGQREAEVAAASFWIGGVQSQCEVEVDLPGVVGRVLEVACDERGRLRVRAEPGLPFPIRCATGTVGGRFEAYLDGDTLNVGPALVRLRHRVEAAGDAVEALDPGALAGAPGTPVGAWYRTFMAMADQLEGVKAADQMVQAALAAVLAATGADRVHVAVDDDGDEQGWFLARPDDRRPFRVSRSLVAQVRAAGQVVHVPVAAADPVARAIHSIRSEGISSAVAVPVHALGKTLGVMYADCTSPGAVLSAEDLQRLVFVARMLATALGNRVLVDSLLEPAPAGGEPAALQSRSPACAEFVQRVKLYAPADYTVLVRGETGTGKEVVARALHALSRRRKGPFVPVNCAAIPAELMESVLFGHEKGAFTGALQARRGHFEEAHGGTLFLDEIGDMAVELQAKILRVLQDRVVTPIGSRRQVQVDVRIVAATHQDLERMVREGRFREDLYYRLRELEIALPPLRERREDVLELARAFAREAAEELGLAKAPAFSADAEQRLLQHGWRGNIRELRHVVKGAVLRAGGAAIAPAHLDLDRRVELVANPHAAAPAAGAAPAAAAAASAGATAATWRERLEAQEKEALQRTLAEANGNLTRGAELFGVPRTTYREKLVRHGLLEA